MQKVAIFIFLIVCTAFARHREYLPVGSFSSQGGSSWNIYGSEVAPVDIADGQYCNYVGQISFKLEPGETECPSIQIHQLSQMDYKPDRGGFLCGYGRGGGGVGFYVGAIWQECPDIIVTDLTDNRMIGKYYFKGENQKLYYANQEPIYQSFSNPEWVKSVSGKSYPLLEKQVEYRRFYNWLRKEPIPHRKDDFHIHTFTFSVDGPHCNDL